MRKKLLAALLAVCMVMTLLPATVLAASFTDTDGHWAASAIQRWSDAGVVNGKDDGIFDPDGEMTRAEFAKVIVEIMGYTQKATENFTDVDPDAWYADAIAKAVYAKVMNGVGDNKMEPESPITRAQAAVMVCRALDLKPSADASLDAFPDVESVEPWAVDAMKALTERGIVKGVDGGSLAANVMIDRASLMLIADRAIPVYVNGDTVSVSSEAKGVKTEVKDGKVTVSGEVEGAIVAINKADVSVKDATVSDPIVADGSKVALENTKAADVKVTSGELTTDDKSAVASVTVGGADTKVDVKGEVADVTIAPGATGAVVDVPEAAKDKVSNESGSSATINGEKTESKDPEPEEKKDSTGTTTEPKKPDQGSHTHTWATAKGSGDIVEIDTKTHMVKCVGKAAGTDDNGNLVAADPACGETKIENHTWTCQDENGTAADAEHPATHCVCGAAKADAEDVPPALNEVTDDNKAQMCARTHSVNDINNTTLWKLADGSKDENGKAKEPTCETAVTLTYECTGELEGGTPCGRTITVTKAATGHTYETVEKGTPDGGEETTTAPATCTTEGKTVKKCTKCDDVQVLTSAKINHNYVHVASKDKDATCAAAGWTYWVCNRCEAGENESADLASGHVRKEEVAKTTTHNFTTKVVEETTGEGENAVTTKKTITNPWQTDNDEGHYHKCSVCDTPETSKTAHTWRYNDTGKAMTVSNNGTDVSVPASQHYCSVCNKVNASDHVDNKNAAGEDTPDGKCDVCGAKMPADDDDGPSGDTHTHVFSTESGTAGYNNNETNHWHKCTNETGTCDLNASNAENATGTNSNGWGEHNWGSGWNTTGETSTRTCNVCGREETCSHPADQKTYEAAVGNGTSGTHATTCGVCQKTLEPTACTKTYENGTATGGSCDICTALENG